MSAVAVAEVPLGADAFVELEQVTVTYGAGEQKMPALGLTNLTVAKGDFIALVGPAGKSARSRSGSAWRSRTRRCCPGSRCATM